MSYSIGIDIGTSYSCVGIWRDNRVEIIPNDQGNRTTPSCVAFASNQILVGESVVNQSLVSDENVIYNFKRLIGRNFSDEQVQNDLSNYTFTVISKNNDRPYIRVEFKGEIKVFSPEEITAMLLVKLKEYAETFTGKTINDAVIAVPASFNISQRQAIKESAKIAKLNVLNLISETSSVAINYGLDKRNSIDSNVLIVDLGGGTFDVSLLSINNGVFRVKASAGESHLGGEDFDFKMVSHFTEQFKRMHGKNLSSSSRAIRRLKAACERAKRILSSENQASIEIDSILDGIDFYTTISRAQFENLCLKEFNSIIGPIERVLNDSKMAISDINEIVLVGGSSRIPKIQQIIKDYFNGKELNKSINPDEAVARGAAIRAAQRSKRFHPVDGILLLDVTALGLGVKDKGGIMTYFIERNTVFPCSHQRMVTTCFDYQLAIEIEVYEGERSLAEGNSLLGRFKIGVERALRGVPKIKVIFDIDEDGILKVSANNMFTGERVQVTISKDIGRLSKERVDDVLKNAELFKDDDNYNKERIKAKIKFEDYIYLVRDSIRDEEFRKMVSNESLKELETEVLRAFKWLEINEEPFLSQFITRKTEIEILFNRLACRYFQESEEFENQDKIQIV